MSCRAIGLFLTSTCLAGSLAAQQVVMGISGSNANVARTFVNGVTDVQVMGPAPGTVQSTQTIGTESATARITTAAVQSAITCSMSFEHRLDVASAGFNLPEADTVSDVLLQFSSAVPEAVVLQASGALTATGGSFASSMRVDVGNDGIIEWQSAPATPSFSIPLTIGPGITGVRMVMGSFINAVGSMQANMNLALLPAHSTQIDVVLHGCSVPHHLYAFRSFGGGIELGTFGLPPTGPVLLVFGLGVLPFVLPSAAPSPCIVIPTIDIVTVIPSPNGYSLPLPPAVRPVTFWAQAVPIVATGLEATGAYRVQAN